MLEVIVSKATGVPYDIIWLAKVLTHYSINNSLQQIMIVFDYIYSILNLNCGTTLYFYHNGLYFYSLFKLCQKFDLHNQQAS